MYMVLYVDQLLCKTVFVYKWKLDNSLKYGSNQIAHITEQVAQEGNNRSPEEQLAQGINIIPNSKRPFVELLKLLELELKPKLNSE